MWLTPRFEALTAWLFAGCDPSPRQSILAAVAGHHPRLEDASQIRVREHSGGLRVRVLSGHADFAATLRTGAELLGLGAPLVLPDAEIDLIESEPFDDAMRAWVGDTAAWWRAAGAAERRFVAAVKALVIAADVAGSAVPRVHRDPVGWGAGVLGRTCTPTGLRRVVAERLGGAAPRPFQEDVAGSTARVTFVRAGCGSGKTAAAYLWAARRAAGRKLFFCYPTTGTASQGFEDYVPPDRAEAALIHGRATADLEQLRRYRVERVAAEAARERVRDVAASGAGAVGIEHG